jgi:purine-binding chemotaxis protein CheW
MDRTHPEAAAPRAASAVPARFLVFGIGGQEFALPLEPIVEIVPFRHSTPVPGAEREVLGIVPLRGRMVTVVDGRRRLGLTESPGAPRGKLIVLRDGGDLLGIVVETVVRVAVAGPGQPEPLPASLQPARQGSFAGVLRAAGGYTLLLDVAALLKSAA